MEFKLMTLNGVARSRRPALRQGNGGGRRRDAPRVVVLRRVLRVRSLAKQFGLPLCDRAHLKAMTDGELHAYSYNLDDRIKRQCDGAWIRRSPSGASFPMKWKPGN
jgi:hypothetical protein